MKWIAPVTLALIAVAACIAVVLVKALKPTCGGAFLCFAVWLVLPHATLTAVLVPLRSRADSLLRTVA